MQWLLAPYAHDFNDRHKRRGNLFHSRFYSKRVRSTEQLAAALVYVFLNPVRAGVVEQAELWIWSSYAATIGRTTPHEFLDQPAVLELIESNEAAARVRLERAVREARERDGVSAGVRRRV